MVLIEPLWNWNTIKKYIEVRNICINRTFMELKRRMIYDGSINR